MSGVSVVVGSVVGSVSGSLCLRSCQSSRQWPRVSGEMASGGGIETVGVGPGPSVGVYGGFVRGLKVGGVVVDLVDCV